MKKHLLSLLAVAAVSAGVAQAAAPNMAVEVNPYSAASTGYRISIPESFMTENDATTLNAYEYEKSFTMATWFKCDNASGLGVLMGHRAQEHDNDNGSFITMVTAGGKLMVKAGATEDYNTTVEDVTFEPGTWYFVVMSYDADTKTAKTYVNGECVEEHAFTTALRFFGDDPCILALGGREFDGAFDEYMFWDRALTDEEVVTASVKPQSVEGIVLHYDFNNVIEGTTSQFANIAGSEQADVVATLKSWTRGSGWESYVSINVGGETEPSFVEGREIPVDYDCSSLGTHTRSERAVTGMTISDGSNTYELTGIQTSSPYDIYVDKSDVVFETTPGATITIDPESNASWMHSYIYVDWANDGFSYTTPADYLDIDPEAGVAEQYKLRPGVDLMAYTRWCPSSNELYWYDTNGYVGQNTGGNNIHDWNLTDPVSFTIPEDTKPGTYRVRYKSAWNQLDPNGVPDIQLRNTLASDGGCIVDFVIEVKKAEERPEGKLKITANIDGDGSGIVQYKKLGTNEYLELDTWVDPYFYYVEVIADEDSYISACTIWYRQNGGDPIDVMEAVNNGDGRHFTTRPQLTDDFEVNVTFTKSVSIDVVGVDTEAPAEYYNLQGVRVDSNSLVPGIYVRRSGDKAVKVLVK